MLEEYCSLLAMSVPHFFIPLFLLVCRLAVVICTCGARLDRSISVSFSHAMLHDKNAPCAIPRSRDDITKDHLFVPQKSRQNQKPRAESRNHDVDKATNLYTDTSFGSVAKAGASVTCFFSLRAAGTASEARTRALTSSTAKGGFQAMAASSAVRSLPQE